MMAGLAGALEAPDVPRLLPLAPEFLVFRSALRATGSAPETSDADMLTIIRALIPMDARAAGKDHASPAAVDYRLLSPRGSHGPDKDAIATDRVFVRDLVLPVRIALMRVSGTNRRMSASTWTPRFYDPNMASKTCATPSPTTSSSTASG
jgi:hypothetical protein